MVDIICVCHSFRGDSMLLIVGKQEFLFHSLLFSNEEF